MKLWVEELGYGKISEFGNETQNRDVPLSISFNYFGPKHFRVMAFLSLYLQKIYAEKTLFYGDFFLFLYDIYIL